MIQKLPSRLALALCVSLAGCASPASLSPMLGGRGGVSAVPAGSENSLLTPGSGSVPHTPASTAPAAAPQSADGSGAAAPQSPVAGIGLSTFFDTYNFNFPVPEGDALGAVARTSHPLVAPEGGKVYLQIGLQTTDVAPKTRQPLNISFVFDKSGSMYGEKIDYARLAAKNMVDALGEGDTFSLVSFDTEVTTTIAPGLATDKPAWKSLIDLLQPGSGTNIDGGLTMGYSHVQAGYKAEKINRVILMSDGQATEGITDAETLGTRAQNFAKDGVSLTTIGVGTGFNEAFMTTLANAGKGTFYFVNSAEDATKAFAGEVQALQRTAARNVKLAIHVKDGVKVVQVFGHTSKTEGQSLNVDSNDLILSQSKVILLELDVPAAAAGTEQAIADVTVDYDDAVFGGHKQAKAEATVAMSADAAAREAKMDASIASSVIILQTASVLLRAADLMDQGQRAQAKSELLQQFETVTSKAGELKDADLQAEAANLKQYVDRFDTTDAEVLKKELQYDAFQKQQGKKKVVTTSYRLQPASCLAIRRMA